MRTSELINKGFDVITEPIDIDCVAAAIDNVGVIMCNYLLTRYDDEGLLVEVWGSFSNRENINSGTAFLVYCKK
jgi:hypothetical protein